MRSRPTMPESFLCMKSSIAQKLIQCFVHSGGLVFVYTSVYKYELTNLWTLFSVFENYLALRFYESIHKCILSLLWITLGTSWGNCAKVYTTVYFQPLEIIRAD